MKQENFTSQDDYNDEIDLVEFYEELKKNSLWIIVFTILGIIASLIVTFFFIQPKYESYSTIYIQPTVKENQVNYNDVLTSQKMATTYTEIAKSNKVLDQVNPIFKQYLDANDIYDALMVESVKDTQIISITATTNDPNLSAKLVNRVVNVFVKEVKLIVEIDNLRVIDKAVSNPKKVSPSNKLNVLIGGILGFIASVGLILLRKMLNRTIQTRQDAESILGLPVLAEVYFND